MPLPLPSLTRRLNAMAEHPGFGADAVQAELSQSHPRLLAQILADASKPERFAVWGQSSNLESDATRELVHPRLLSALCTLARVDQPTGAAANAGLLHTYGYLLSNRRTPYGFKRERWTQQILEMGLELRPGLLSPVPPEGTLLQNVTALSHAVWNPRSAAGQVPLTADGNPFRGSGMTLLEQPENSPVRLLTRLIPFSQRRALGSHAAALFHAWEDGGHFRFITLFPVEYSVLNKLLDQFRREAALVKPRFNSVIPGLMQDGHPGRIWMEPAASPH